MSLPEFKFIYWMEYAHRWVGGRARGEGEGERVGCERLGVGM
jgi:hypothetical protein